MIEICIYFEKDKLNDCLAALQQLNNYKPIYFGMDEELKDKKSLLTDEKRFSEFMKKNSEGFFLHAENCLYNFTISSIGYSILHVDPNVLLTKEWIENFFELISIAEPKFGYAADYDEFKYRNRIYKTLGINHIESWVGRDLTKYIPGLYCYTLLSMDQLEISETEFSELSQQALSVTKMSTNEQIVLFNFYDDFDLWKHYKKELDALCKRLPSFFSKDEVQEDIKNVSNYIEFCNATDKWL